MRLFVLLAVVSPLFAQDPPKARKPSIFDKITEQLGVGKPPASGDKTADGIREALRIGAEKAVALIAKPDGYFRNELIKILMPEKLRAADKALRAVGLGKMSDAFILSMNRAAEAAAPAAKPIFVDAVKKMTFDDARRILMGNDTAATQYFKDKTSADLAAAFKPVIDKSIDETGVVKFYNQMFGKIPFMKDDAFHIHDYVLQKSLDGVFLMLGEEEKRIRKDPAARVTQILRDVFGGR